MGVPLYLHGDFFKVGVDSAGLEKDHTVGGADMLGRHGRQHGDARAAKDNLPVLDLSGRGYSHHLTQGVRSSRQTYYLLSSPTA
jgi:hypothetical protein